MGINRGNNIAIHGAVYLTTGTCLNLYAIINDSKEYRTLKNMARICDLISPKNTFLKVECSRITNSMYGILDRLYGSVFRLPENGSLNSRILKDKVNKIQKHAILT